MRFYDFVEALLKAGWRPMLDAQHTEVRKLWKDLFPVIAALEDELERKMNEMQTEE
jgi:hypothetical protein